MITRQICSNRLGVTRVALGCSVQVRGISFSNRIKGIELLKNASDINPLNQLPSILKEDLDENLCTCMDVPKMDVINAIANGTTTVEEVKKQTYTEMGAGCCIQRVERLIECLCAPEPHGRRSRRTE